MGRQFRFYILPAEANALIERLRSRFGAKLFVDNSPKYELFEVDLPYRERSDGGLESINGSNRYYLAASPKQILRRYCAKPNWWIIDSDSEGIEFSCCEFDGNVLRTGRFWHWTNFVRDMQFVPKSREFLTWSEAVYRDTKKFLRYDPALYAYVGKQAVKFRESGGRFAD